MPKAKNKKFKGTYLDGWLWAMGRKIQRANVSFDGIVDGDQQVNTNIGKADENEKDEEIRKKKITRRIKEG